MRKLKINPTTTDVANRQPIVAGDRGIEQSLGRASAVLDALAHANQGLRFTDLMRETNFSKATLHRLLGALTAYGFLEVDEAGLYYIGFQLGSWANSARDRLKLDQRAIPLIRALSLEVGETSYLSVRAADMAICIALQEGSAPVRALPLHIGDKSALGVGSANAAILAAIKSDDEIASILRSEAHQRYCLHRKVDQDFVLKHIRRTRELGYSFVDDLNPDMTGIGMAICNKKGDPVAALSVAAIQRRMADETIRQTILQAMKKTHVLLEPLFRLA